MNPASIYNIPLQRIDHTPGSMAEYRGRVLVIVNTASKCGFTPQYQALEQLWQRHRDAGLTVLGFPCNQFGSQEPGTSTEIQSFCEVNYGVTFPLFAKTDVNGANAHPLFQLLKAAKPGLFGLEAIKWNFTKFLVDRDGRVMERYAPATKPATLDPAVISALSAAPLRSSSAAR